MKRFYETKFFRQFIPFMILVIGGSFFVEQFTKIRYKYRTTEQFDFRKETAAHGIVMNKPATLEEEYEKIKTLDLDNWENVRISRPWEEPNSTSN
ncbi:Cytochrome c oxidase assembly protein COX16-like protein, mitochondrial [Habropoda laboriosa]|uniref:Cytochrome c oxidase assembly protein COX16 homolog, mitochondrial n=1 Tax=Habropoda laboriosa TaxID=597456 RepID=A0A0L7RK41_9HYME|nr:PREDICTED: cytochrome c oxidase assembly protein COX16 homolog, mitochondrial [Habropoda laboriosa]KOC71199.1 Cytochrome c oxidase assembly protein COX16-like protein, mitochondrial [Habropoda laboriosa]